jgi:hypothetical protein
MHNMIVIDEHGAYDGNFDYDYVNNGIPSAEASNGSHSHFLETYTLRSLL